MAARTHPYQLAVDGLDPAIRVLSLIGTEAMSEAWQFDVTITAPAGDDVERVALGQRATLIFNLTDEQRAFYGVVAAMRLVEVIRNDDSVKCVVRVVPRLWLLKRKKRTRIFQNMRVPDIVSQVLLEAGITTRWQLTRAYPDREYCTQYEETDYHFVRRIMAEVGIYFYFFGGGPVGAGALAADAAEGAVAVVGSSIGGLVGGSAVGGLIGAAAQMAETLIPGDTVIGADDASSYPPVAGDDPAALAASTAAAMAPAVGDVLGAGGGIAGAAIGAASAVAGTVIADLTEADRSVPTFHVMAAEVGNVSTYDKVTRFTLRNTVRSSAATFRDYDPDRPMVRLQSTAVSTVPFPPSPLEIAAAAAAAAENMATAASALPGPAGSALGAIGGAISTADTVVNEVGAALGQKVPFEVYEHHGPFLFPKWAFGADEAPRILRQKRRRASIGEGEGGCSDASPGHRFALADHLAPELDGPYVLTRVEHRGELHPREGEHRRVYWNTFECAPAVVTYTPPRPKRASVQVTLTATVVGPAGEEIYVDDKGQIKVQFHWDRDGTYDENSSCWIRVMQPWAGAGWGHQFIPRVGMEVVVTFEGGDPDKPMVLGAVPNGTHPLPFVVPRDKTRSGIRTQTSRGGGGFNELSFEDAAGAEQVYLRAQRDLDRFVVHDRTAKIGNDDTTFVGGNQRLTVHRNRHQDVLENLGESVTLSRTSVVGTTLTERVGEDRTLAIGGNDTQSVKGDRVTAVQGGLKIDVRGDHTVTVGTPEKKRSLDVYASGQYALGSDGGVDIRAKDGITLQCGDSSIRIADKEIRIFSPTISLVATKALKLKGDGPSMSLGDDATIMAKTVRIVSSKSSVELGDEAKIDSPQVKVNCGGNPPSDGADPDAPPDLKPLMLKVMDVDLTPFAGKDYVLVAAGRKYEGTTGGDGTVTEQVPATATAAQLTVWESDRPVGLAHEYHIDIGDLADIGTPRGVRQRLQNLGYVWSGDGDNLDPVLREAVTDFQREQGLDPTGEIDGPLQGKLKELHGY